MPATTAISTGTTKKKNDDDEVRISTQHDENEDGNRVGDENDDGNDDNDNDDNSNKITTIRNCYCPNCENKKLSSDDHTQNDDENDTDDTNDINDNDTTNDCITMMYPTTIPGFREIVCMTTSCNNCHYKSTQVTYCGTYQQYGQKLILTIPPPWKLDTTLNGNDQYNDNNNTIPSLSSFFNRQIIKSDTATIYIPTFKHGGLEIPRTTQQGCITTIEGILQTTMKHLQSQQSQRLLSCNQNGDLTMFYNCQTIIQQIQSLLNLVYRDNNEEEEETGGDDEVDEDEASSSSSSSLFPFVFIVDDPGGNSYIENPYAPKHDPYVQIVQYQRTVEQDVELLGLQPQLQQKPSQPSHTQSLSSSSSRTLYSLQSTNQDATKFSHDGVVGHAASIKDNTLEPTDMVKDEREEITSNDVLPATTTSTSPDDNDETIADRYKEVMIFPNTPCPNCYSSDKCETKMLPTKDLIPHFKECILMCIQCENCGYKCNELKSCGPIPSMGTKLTLSINSMQDLKRDVIKSDTCSIQIPNLDIELLHGGSITSSYTTIEGLLRKIYDQLYQHNPFHTGDSSLSTFTSTFTSTAASTTAASSGSQKSSSTRSTYYKSILDKLQGIANGFQEYMPCTLILIDPLGNSFIGPQPSSSTSPSLEQLQDEDNENSMSSNPTSNSNLVGTTTNGAFNGNDANLLLEEYERTYEENESLGLNDIQTEGYEATTTRPTSTSHQ